MILSVCYLLRHFTDDVKETLESVGWSIFNQGILRLKNNAIEMSFKKGRTKNIIKDLSKKICLKQR